jgi:hypothetical protein
MPGSGTERFQTRIRLSPLLCSALPCLSLLPSPHVFRHRPQPLRSHQMRRQVQPTLCHVSFISMLYIQPRHTSLIIHNLFSYKIISNIARPGFSPGNFVVERRYSDFSWLWSELSYQNPGIIVPSLPDKQTVGRFTPEFIESRRRGLEKFLLRVLAHSDLGQSHLMATFLQASEDVLNRAKEEIKAAKPKITSTAMAWFEGTVNTLSSGKVSRSLIGSFLWYLIVINCFCVD